MFNRNLYRGVLMILFIGTPFYCFLQNPNELELGDQYFNSAGEYFGVNSDSVIHYISKASDQYKKGEHWEKYILTLNAFCSYHDLKNDFKKRQEYALLALEESEKYLDQNNITKAISKSNHSFYLKDIGNFSAAIKNFREVMEIEKMNKKYDYLVVSLKNIGNTYEEIGDLDQAIKYYEECLRIESEHPNSLNPQNKIDVYTRMGIAFYRKKNLPLAQSYLEEANQMLLKGIQNKTNINNVLAIEIYYSFAKIQLAKNNVDSLNFFIDKAAKFCTGSYERDKDIGFMLKGKYYLKDGNKEKAILALENAKDLVELHFKKYAKHIKFTEIYNLLASAYLENDENQKALSYFRKALYNLSKQDKEGNEELVPIIDNLFNPYYSMQAYAGIGRALHNQYLVKKDVQLLEASHKSFDLATQLIFDVRRTYQEENSLLRFSEEVIPIYESSIASAINMYENTSDQIYLEKAFDYNEKSKAILLLESINKSSAMDFSSIPDSLIQKENELKYQISSLERRLYDEKNTLEDKNQLKIDQLNNQLFSDAEKYEALLRKFESDFPKYYQLKYDKSTASIGDLQERLQNTDNQLIEFFYGTNYTYVFAISATDIQVQTIDENPKHLTEINNIKNFLSTPPAGLDIKNQMTNYINSSQYIYETFLKQSIFPTSKHLIIITDGALGYLPFEALITQPQEPDFVSFSLENLSYLIEDYLISYSYSSTLLLNSLDSEIKGVKNTFCGVAPSFGMINSQSTRVCNENALYSLQCSEDEVNQIQNQIGGKVLIGKEATLEKTKAEIANSRIIHLATHACLDDSNPEFNKIYLADDYLSNNDLYNLDLSSELAVLSACETGSGKLAKGEGVMSLARGFIHAGCPSIIMSLWSIDDCATSKIMVNFYDELYKGTSKAESLRNAKLKYINEAKRANQHPYYWAAFVQIGNYNSIDISSSNIIYYLLLGCLLISLFFYSKKVSKK